ncbi:MAG TPA: SAM-dependent DNA methyltransferase [Hydrogenothermaceae bacterium]|nr:SAM-dependent DNA methyltransferase [Hydrogenothermaceae bacterium]HIQ51467.1 SAM-dependent DNA methyltransferase [Nautiliaceae bacterium]
MANLDIKTLENWLWEAACKIRGEIDAPKYKEYILPLIFIKRLSDVFEDEVEKLIEEFGDKETALEVLEADHSLVKFYVPEIARWESIKKHPKNGLGLYLTDVVRALAKENPKLQGVVDIVDFNATQAGKRIISDERLHELINTLSKYRLGIKDVPPDIIGHAYEYLLRKFAEGSGQSAGEFYTPAEVGRLMARILDPEPGQSIYDPCVGSAGLLIKAQLYFKDKYKDQKVADLKFYGQEILHFSYAMARMNIFIHDMDAEVALGDTMNHPAFKNDDGSLMQFDLIATNPMWNQDFPQSTYENDSFNRFIYGYPPSSSADWGWLQHVNASLKENGKAAVVLDTGSVSRGSGTEGRNRERDIRKKFVENDLIEAVILLPENLFYNTTAPGVIIVLNKNKKHKNEILLINASEKFTKGRPKNILTEEGIKEIAEVYHQWKEVERLSKIITKEEAERTDYNLSPSRYITISEENKVLPLEDAIVLVKEAEEERIKAEKELKEILEEALGMEL